MKVWCKLLIAAVIVFVVPSAARASVGGNAIPKYSFGQIFSHDMTVDLIPTTNGSGNVWGVRCIFGSTDSVDIKFTVDGGTVRTISLDPLNFEEDEGTKLVSGWIPMDIAFSTSIHVQMHNTTLSAGNINCWASWGTN